MTCEPADRRDRGTRRCRGVLTGVVSVVVLSACGADGFESADAGEITVPPTALVTESQAAAPTTAERPTVALEESWFARDADRATEAIERLGIFVAAFAVCSGSVEEGEVRQITTGEGVILDDEDGLTDAARHIEIGSVVQMKVGTGSPCD